jgi:hypothetical protein
MRSICGVKDGSRRDFSVRIKDVTMLFNHTNGSPHRFVFKEQQKPCPQWKNRNGFNSLITGIIGNKNNKRGGGQGETKTRRNCPRNASFVHFRNREGSLISQLITGKLNSENEGSFDLQPHRSQVPLF